MIENRRTFVIPEGPILAWERQQSSQVCWDLVKVKAKVEGKSWREENLFQLLPVSVWRKVRGGLAVWQAVC
jgi:hypothetical protein